MQQNIFVIAAAMLILGFIAGRLVGFLKLPRVTGYIIVGIVFGPSILKLFSESSVTQLDFLTQITLAIIALIIGAGLSFPLLKRLGWGMVLITLLQSLGAFVLTLLGLFLLKMPLEASLLLAAIATATDPSATLAVIKQYRCHGILTETSLAVVALDDAVAIIMFGLIMTINLKSLTAFGEAALHSIAVSGAEILTAFIIGLALALFVHLFTRFIKEPGEVLIILLGTVLLSIGLTTILNSSSLLANMFLGLILVNLSFRNDRMVEESLNRLTPPIYCFFFVLSGAFLDFKVFAAASALVAAWGAVNVIARIAGKMGGAYLGGVLAQSPENIKKYLGLTLIPQAGIAVGLPLMIRASSPFYPFRSLIINLTLVSVAFNIILGPVLTKYALFKAKEATVED